jgi:hypothetical protein
MRHVPHSFVEGRSSWVQNISPNAPLTKSLKVEDYSSYYALIEMPMNLLVVVHYLYAPKFYFFTYNAKKLIFLEPCPIDTMKFVPYI